MYWDNLFEPFGLACLGVAVLHLAAFAWSWRQAWHIAAPLWLLRADLAAVLAYNLWRIGELASLGSLEFVDSEALFAGAALVLLGLGFLRLPAAVIWPVYALATLLAIAVVILLLTFRLQRLW